MNYRVDIKKVNTQEDKEREENFLRKLWRECFGDPAKYEDFYFKNVYRNNMVYAIQEKGMLHLNPYRCMVREKEMTLHYIVGVATKESARRQGIMRKLLAQTLEDMYKEEEPFTYLMPADVRYYQPFGFVSISEKQENIIIRQQEVGKNTSVEMSSKNSSHSFECYEKNGEGEKKIYFTKYNDFLALRETKQQEIFQSIHQLLSERYAVFARHDKDYFDLLFEEKRCQGGDVVFCFDGKGEIKGFFAYGMDEGKMHVEQYLSKDNEIADCLNEYCDNIVPVLYQFPFMVRIVHVKTFLSLFTNSFYEFAMEGKRLLITDAVLADNNGIYSFQTISACNGTAFF